MTKRYLSKLLMPSTDVFTNIEIRNWMNELLLALDRRTADMDIYGGAIQTDIAKNATDIVQIQTGSKILVVEHHTVDDTLTEAESGSVHSNKGCTGGLVILTLPSAPSAGIHYWFTVAASGDPLNPQILRIQPGPNDAIYGMSTIADGRAYEARSYQSFCHLVSDADGDWLAINMLANWY